MLPPADRQRAIVLVHGAWVGEWSWEPILGLLRASGRPVHTVSLTGHGVKRHQSGPHVTLFDHIADVVSYVEVADLTEVTLVGHSYGGRVITPVYEQISERIGRLVYLDAHAPTAPDSGQSPERIAQAQAGGGMIQFGEYEPDPTEVGGPDGLAWFLDRVMPQSFATFCEPLVGDLPDDLPKTYVYATGSGPSRFSGYAEAAAADPAWDYVELDGSHWLMFSHPREVADIILR